MEEEVKDYVRSCDVCQRDKTSRRKKYGLLQPLDIPHQPWKSILMDFIVGVTPNEALPHIGRQPRRNAKDDRCNLPALL